jgi:DNA-binding transcriptional MerR regulator
MGVVERLTGLTRRRIRYYEKWGMLNPSRTEGGHRLYSPENLETLKRIKRILDSGITTMEAVRRMLASGFDLPVQDDGGRQWSSRSDALGDAAVRIMRPIPVPASRPSKTPETDSPAYFRRVNVLQESGKKRDNA